MLSELIARTIVVTQLFAFSAVVLLILQAIAILILSKFRPVTALRATVRDAFLYCVHPLLGDDGRFSWSKIVALLLIIGYFLKGVQFMPQGVAYWLIAASHGVKVLMALINKFSMGVTSTEQITQAFTTKFSKQVVELVRSKRDADTGEPLPGAPGQEPEP